MGKIEKLFIFHMKTGIKVMAVWIIVLSVVMSVYMCFFPTMQEMAQVKFDMLPEEYLKLMGVENISQMNNYVTYFGMIFNILIIVISIYAAISGVQLIKKEEQNKTIEYLYSMSVTRKQIYVAKVLTAFCSIMLTVFFTGIAGIICGVAVGNETFNVIKITEIIKITGTIPFFFMAVGIAISSSCRKYASGGLAAGIVMISYMLGYLGEIIGEKGEWLKYFCPFQLLSPNNVIDKVQETYLPFGGIALIIIILLLISAYTYNRRDYNI